MQRITFSVSYTLSEYLSIVLEHAPVLLARHARTRSAKMRAPSSSTRMFIVTVATIAFFVKKLQMPVCEFVLDEHGIARTTAAGKLVVQWPEVLDIHRYARGFVIEKARGSMLLPYQCFSAEQSSAFVSLIEAGRPFGPR